MPPLLFARKVHIIINHNTLVTNIWKDITTLQSQWLQSIVLRTHQYRICIPYNPGLDLFISD